MIYARICLDTLYTVHLRGWVVQTHIKLIIQRTLVWPIVVDKFIHIIYSLALVLSSLYVPVCYLKYIVPV